MKTEKTVRNCRIKVEVNCPKDWDELQLTDQDKVRFCDSCKNDVYFCETDEETITHALNGHCIAREIPSRDELPILFLGRVKAQPEETETQKEALRWSQRETGINEVLKLKNPKKFCENCKYPTSEWSNTCKVCGKGINDAKIYKA